MERNFTHQFTDDPKPKTGDTNHFMSLRPVSSTKNIFSLLLVFSTLFLSCSKDFLKSYEKRIIGQWHVRDVKRIGIGGNVDFLPFQDGTFVFNQDGTLTYRNSANQQFEGTWEITRRTINDQLSQSLQITAIDFVNERVLSEYYDDLIFRSSDHFVGNTVENFRTYVTHFRR